MACHFIKTRKLFKNKTTYEIYYKLGVAFYHKGDLDKSINYLKNTYQEKVFKVSLNGNFSCPNRDGTISTNGCIFCSEKGSGDFAGEREKPIKEQFKNIKEMMHLKWNDGYYIAYFQANTNTYDTVENLRKRFGRSAINRAVVLRDEKFVQLDIRDSHSLGSLGKNKVTEDEIELVVSKMTGIPVTKMVEGEKKKLLNSRKSFVIVIVDIAK